MTTQVKYFEYTGVNKAKGAAETALRMADHSGTSKVSAENAAVGTVAALAATIDERKLETKEAIAEVLNSDEGKTALTNIVREGVLEEMKQLKKDGFLKQ